jgi:hypothetical protein
MPQTDVFYALAILAEAKKPDFWQNRTGPPKLVLEA